MVTLMEALTAERAKRNQNAADRSTRQQIGLAVLEALAHKLNAEPIPGWAFVLEGQQIRIARITQGARVQVATWTVDDNMRLMSGEQMTEWISAESYGRVIDEAIEITAKLIVEAETTGVAKSSEPSFQGAEIVELPPRF
jgi:hypothetical protein